MTKSSCSHSSLLCSESKWICHRENTWEIMITCEECISTSWETMSNYRWRDTRMRLDRRRWGRGNNGAWLQQHCARRESSGQSSVPTYASVTLYPKTEIKNTSSGRRVTQWQNICLACLRSCALSPTLQGKQKVLMDLLSNITTTSNKPVC